MDRTVIGAFREQGQADRAIRELKQRGFSEKELSVVAKKDDGQRGNRHDGIGEGLGWGAGVGGVVGLLAGVGALAIPGIGPIVAAGPIAAALTGAATGGVAGGLLDFGVPAGSTRRYEEDIKAGEVVAMVRAASPKVDQAADVFRRQGAHDVEVH
ncbi:MAG: hypothetical protein M0031_01495 [Thermaerobacter sp.]|nr:hypothetical protein [Thermaerobacter sp.]